ncbi:LysR family transcriptional regulator [Nocardia xishanensis]|uniref:LysR family transcriptional regulator n=1 Tax=Nocardia xishanensis TaxID=238964 RepID=A0ABW7XC02_9NOCA
MEMFHLRYFVAVAQELSFTRAAARLHLATSPLSQRIKDLERELDCLLFVRAHHRITLTPAGESLLPLAIDVITRFDTLPEAVHGDAATGRHARIGIAPDVPPQLRDDILASLSRAHPDITPQLIPASTEPLRRKVIAGEIDIALVHGPVVDRGVRVRRLSTQAAGAAIARGIGFDHHRSVRLSELANLSYASIDPEAAPEVYRRTDQALTRAGVHGRIVIDGDNLAGLAHIVAAGQAFTFVGMESGATHKAFAGEPVLILPVVDVNLRLSSEVIWQAGRGVNGDIVEDLIAVAASVRPSGGVVPFPSGSAEAT